MHERRIVILSAAKNLTHSNWSRSYLVRAIAAKSLYCQYGRVRRKALRRRRNLGHPNPRVILRSAFGDEESQPCSRTAIDAPETCSGHGPGDALLDEILRFAQNDGVTAKAKSSGLGVAGDPG